MSDVIARSRQCRVPKVVAKVKMRIISPYGPYQPKGSEANTLAIARNLMQLGRHECFDLLE